jgi:putative serine protease PepD
MGRSGGFIEISPGGVPTRTHRVLAPIYPGDSGAPVLDREGRFLGLISAASTPGRHPVKEELGEIRDRDREVPAGEVGFAVPSRECRRAWMDLRDFGRVRRGYLGVRIAAVNDGSGARVLNVRPGGPAASAGLLPGDVVTTFDSVFVRGAHQFCAFVAFEEPFRQVPMRILRDGREQVLTVTIGIAQELPRMQPMNLEDLGKPLDRQGPPRDGLPVTQDADR